MACNRGVESEAGKALSDPAPASSVLAAEVASANTGLDFPSNGAATNDVRFRFTSPNLQPMYPATYIWKVKPRQQAGYYTTFFWGPGSGDFTGTGYYGAHPYPDGSNKPTSTAHKWEISADGNHTTTDANGHSTQLGYDTWKTQAFRAYDNGTNKVHEFYWDLPDTTKVIRVLLSRSYGNTAPPSPALTFGTAPWSPGSEHLSGVLRGLQLYSASLTSTAILAEADAPLSTPTGSANVWYLNLNPTPEDIADKSGKGHHPAWVTSLRPTLWTESGTPTAPTVTLAANPASVNAGSASTLTWTSANATSCNAGGAWTGSKALSGNQSTGALTATSTFTLTCTGPGGSANASATVTVAANPPPTVSLTANPATVISGSSSTLTWSSTNATSCNASGAWTGTKTLDGSQATSALTATSTFTLTCTGPGGSAAQSATVTVQAPPPGGSQSGLDFPSNGAATNDVRFRFTSPNLQPMYPATYIWKVKPRQQAGYYTTFFWGPGAGDFTGTGYYGAHPYPDGSNKSTSTAHKWEISADGTHTTTDANGHSTQLGYDTWKTQAFRAYDNGTNKVHEFYWDLPDTTKVIRVLLSRSYGNTAPPSPALTFGTAPWSPGSEHLSGVLRGLQLYSASLTSTAILAEADAPLSTSAGSANVWYLNLNPTPDDIADKSGKGHHPAWVTSLRPTLWTESGTPTAPTVSLSASPASVSPGGASTLTWTSANATSCNASGAWTGSKALSGNAQTGALNSTSTFTLTCTGAGGTTAKSVTVTVAANPPPTVSLTANPSSVNSGSASTLTWSSANATSCNAGGAWNGNKSLSGNQSTGALTATSTFTLTCTGAGGSAAQSATVTVLPQGGSQSGLDFPSNGPNTNDVRFRFVNSNLQPMYPATYIFRVKVRQQRGYYTTFFWGPGGAFTGDGYYGAHPYPTVEPKTESLVHKWEVSIRGVDIVDDANGHSTQLGYDTWKIQAFRAFDNGTNKIHEFYWDLPDTTKVIRVVLEREYGNNRPLNPALTWGTAPWAPGGEHLSGILRGIQLYSSALSVTGILSEVNAPLSTTAGSANVWYMNINPTPGDIADKSGKGHNPEWATSLRPALWTGP